MGFYEIVLFAYSIVGSASIGYLIVVIASPQTRRMPEQYRYGASILAGGVLTAAAIATTIGAEVLLQKEDLFFAIFPITAAIAVLFAIIARFSLKQKAVIPQKTSIYTETKKIGRIEVKQKIDETKKTEIEKLVEKKDFRKKETANVQMAGKKPDEITIRERQEETKDMQKIKLPMAESKKETKPFFPNIFIKKQKTETEKKEIQKIAEKIELPQKAGKFQEEKKPFLSGFFKKEEKPKIEQHSPASDFERKILEAGRQAEMKAKKTETTAESEEPEPIQKEETKIETRQEETTPEQENDIERIREILKSKAEQMGKINAANVPGKEFVPKPFQKEDVPQPMQKEIGKKQEIPEAELQHAKIDSEKKEEILKILRELKEKPSAAEQIKNAERENQEFQKNESIRQIKNELARPKKDFRQKEIGQTENPQQGIPRRLQRFHRFGESQSEEQSERNNRFDSENEMTDSLLYGTQESGSRQKRDSMKGSEKADYDSMAENIFTQIKKQPPAEEEKQKPAQESERIDRRHRRDFAETENTAEQKIPAPLEKSKAIEEKKIPQNETEEDFGKEMQLEEELKSTESEKLELDDLEKGLTFGEEKEEKSELCPNCSKETELVIFCPNCGTAFCDNCSKKTETGKHYCPSCGKIV